MNKFSPRFLSALDAVRNAGQHLAPDEQDDVAVSILALTYTSDLPSEAVKPLLAAAEAAIARGEVYPWVQVRDDLRAKLDALPR